MPTPNNLLPATNSPMKPLVSMRELEQLLGRKREEINEVASIAGSLYRPFERRKHRGVGKWRFIDNPKERLKEIQTLIQDRILSRHTFPDYILGYLKKRTVKHHAAPHVGQPIVVSLDIKDYFMNVHDRAVFKTYRETYRCSPKIAAILTKLTTLQHRLPQGAPTSPILANATSLNMYHAINKVCEDMGLRFTSYGDDITMSGKCPLEAIEPIIRIVQKHGFSISRKKIHRMPHNSCQELMGIVVNNKMSVSKEKRTKLASEITSLKQHPAISKSELCSIRGKINHVKTISPNHGARLNKYAGKVLPQNVIPSPKKSEHEVRSCKNVRLHRKRKRAEMLDQKRVAKLPPPLV